MVAASRRTHCPVRQHHARYPDLPHEWHGRRFHQEDHLTSYFDNSGGLRIGAPVRLEGVELAM